MSNPVIHSAPRAIHAARFGIAMAVCGSDLVAAERFAAGKGWTVVEDCCKGLISAQTAADFAAATAPIFGGFVESLRAETIIGKLRTRPAMLNIRTIVGAGAAVAAFAGEGAPKPLTAGAFSAVSLPPRKCTAWAIVTSEVVKASHQHAEQIVLGELQRAVVESIDQHFIDPSAAGSITAGAPTITSTGSSLAQIDADLKAVLLQAGDMKAPAWVLNPSSAVYLSTLRGSGGVPAFGSISMKGGQLLGLPAIASSAVARSGSPSERAIVLVDADQVLYADDGETEISIAKSASVQMSDTPIAGSTSLVSLWQASLIGLRVERWLAWHRVRDSAVIVLDGVEY